MRNLDTDAEIARFNQSVDEFTTLMNVIMAMSNGTDGRIVESWRKEYGSHIFTKLFFHALAIRRVIPDLSPENKFIFWDISSMSVLARALMETYYVFYYVAVDDISNAEDLFRHNIWEYHSVTSRLAKLKKIKSIAPQIAEYEKQQDFLKQKIVADSLFAPLPEGTRKKILKGDMPILLSNSELSKLAGIDPDCYKAMYNGFSSYVHTHPYCVSQLAAFYGVNADTVNLFTTNMSFCTGFLAHAVRDFVKIFPDQECHITEEISSLIETWEYIFTNIVKVRERELQISEPQT